MGLNLGVFHMGEQGVPTGGTTCSIWGNEVFQLGERKHVFHGYPMDIPWNGAAIALALTGSAMLPTAGGRGRAQAGRLRTASE